MEFFSRPIWSPRVKEKFPRVYIALGDVRQRIPTGNSKFYPTVAITPQEFICIYSYNRKTEWEEQVTTPTEAVAFKSSRITETVLPLIVIDTDVSGKVFAANTAPIQPDIERAGFYPAPAYFTLSAGLR